MRIKFYDYRDKNGPSLQEYNINMNFTLNEKIEQSLLQIEIRKTLKISCQSMNHYMWPNAVFVGLGHISMHVTKNMPWWTI